MRDYVLCAICGDPFERLTESHLLTHGMSFRNYREMFPDHPTISESARENLSRANAERSQRRRELHDDAIECQICGARLREVTWRHLKFAHGITLARYKELYPDVPYRAISVVFKKSTSAKRANADPEKRRRQSERMSGDRNPFFRQTHAPETREKISDTVRAAWERERGKLTQIRREVGARSSGENHPNWKGGYEAGHHGGHPKFRARRRALRIFGEKCMIPDCEFDFVVHNHHIIPRSEGGSHDLDNCVLLCPNHHALADAGMLTRDYLLSLVQQHLPGRDSDPQG